MSAPLNLITSLIFGILAYVSTNCYMIADTHKLLIIPLLLIFVMINIFPIFSLPRTKRIKAMCKRKCFTNRIFSISSIFLYNIYSIPSNDIKWAKGRTSVVRVNNKHTPDDSTWSNSILERNAKNLL